MIILLLNEYNKYNFTRFVDKTLKMLINQQTVVSTAIVNHDNCKQRTMLCS